MDPLFPKRLENRPGCRYETLVAAEDHDTESTDVGHTQRSAAAARGPVVDDGLESLVDQCVGQRLRFSRSQSPSIYSLRYLDVGNDPDSRHSLHGSFRIVALTTGCHLSHHPLGNFDAFGD